jgi:hypothetical protein
LSRYTHPIPSNQAAKPRRKNGTQTLLPKGENFTSEASSQAAAGSDFTSKASVKGEDVKKSLRLLSEVVLRTVK